MWLPCGSRNLLFPHVSPPALQAVQHLLEEPTYVVTQWVISSDSEQLWLTVFHRITPSPDTFSTLSGWYTRTAEKRRELQPNASEALPFLLGKQRQKRIEALPEVRANLCCAFV